MEYLPKFTDVNKAAKYLIELRNKDNAELQKILVFFLENYQKNHYAIETFLGFLCKELGVEFETISKKTNDFVEAHWAEYKAFKIECRDIEKKINDIFRKE